MSGTSGSYNKPANAVFLPAPQVQLYQADNNNKTMFIPRYPVTSTVLEKVFRFNQIKVVPTDITDAVLNNPELNLQLELLRYTRRSSGKRTNVGSGFMQGGYVHPSTFNAGSGRFTRGGLHGGIDSVLQSLRVTEFPVDTQFTPIDVTQAMLSFMALAPVRWRDINDGISFQEVMIPSGNRSSNANCGKRFGYGGALTPGYFKFRWAVRDLSDARKKFISGPLSETVCLSNVIHPFTPTGTTPLGAESCAPASNFDALDVKFYVGPTSRLPG